MYNKEELNNLKARYPIGCVIQLTEDMKDLYSQGKKAGNKGTVICVDDIGQIHVKWETGGSLAVVPEVDSFIILT